MNVAVASPEKLAAEAQPGVFLMTDSFETGGSERQFALFAKSLDPKLFRAQLGCISKRGAFLDGLGEVIEFPLGGNTYGPRSLAARVRLARHLRHSRVSIAHAFDFYSNLTLIPAARMSRVPVVIGSQRQIGDLLTRFRSRSQLAVLNWCDVVVCNSRAAADRLIEQGMPESRITVIRNGLPASAFTPTVPAFPRLPGLLRVGMIARINASFKNHRVFLRAAARLRGKFAQLQFIVVGDGPLRHQYEREAADLGIGNNVEFLGDRRDIPAILASIDVSVLPTASESLSNVIIESMAAGVPVIASRVGGNPELVGEDRGILIPPGDEESLAVETERLLRDQSMRMELGHNAKKFAERHFTIAEMRQRHHDLYSDLLAKKTRKSLHLYSHRPAPTERIRVAMVAASMRYVGGQSVQAKLLVSKLRNDPAVEAHLVPIDPVFPPGLRWAEDIPFLRTLIRQPVYLWVLWRGLKNVDIAHIFSASYWSFLLAPTPAWLIARLRGAKTIIHYHSGEARDHLSRFKTARLVLKRVDLLVVPSGYLADVFQKVGLTAHVVPNVVDLSQFSFRLREPIRPHLICTRGFHPYYGIDVVLRAFAEVKKLYPDAHLDLVGGGPLEADMRRLAKQLGLTDVDFAGVARHDEIATFYDKADIFINASSLDNMPVSILEAFASGTPVVSTAPEGIRYLVEHEHTGLLCEPGDASTLAWNVIRLLRDHSLSCRIAHNAHKQCSRYGWKDVRGQWLGVYESLARTRCGEEDWTRSARAVP